MWYLEFYWSGHNFETNADLVMNFSSKIETNKILSGVKFRSYFTDQKRQYVFWYVNYTTVTSPLQTFAVDKCCYLTLCEYSMSRKLQNSFYNDFLILWRHFGLVCKINKCKEKNWRNFFYLFFSNIKTLCF